MVYTLYNNRQAAGFQPVLNMGGSVDNLRTALASQ